MNPHRILLIKSHSMGVGDVLRSSAAWRALKTRWPEAQLHLLFLSRHAGYPTEQLIREHHLLASAHFVTIKEGDPVTGRGRRVPLARLRREVRDIAKQINPDLVIDFEASGLRTTLVSRWVRSICRAKTVGIAQFPGRGALYDLAAPSTRRYASTRHLAEPMDYTNRDFVALAALNIERNGVPIELECTPDGLVAARMLKCNLPVGHRVVGLNIGCGTPDAVPKRPSLDLLVDSILQLLETKPTVVVLTGAKFERSVNEAFRERLISKSSGDWMIMDTAGETSLSGLTGILSLCDLFISSDSGPYHMAVAMHVPTVALFNFDTPASYHSEAWCRCLIEPDAAAIVQASESLLLAPS